MDTVIKFLLWGAIAIAITGMFALFGSETALACGYGSEDNTIEFPDSFLQSD
jgi:hypothetical protein